MDIFGFDMSSFASFLLTFMRISFVVFMMPFYSGEYIPVPVKAALCLVLTMALVLYRVFRGPRAQDRVLGLDTLYVIAMLILLTFGIETGRDDTIDVEGFVPDTTRDIGKARLHLLQRIRA